MTRGPLFDVPPSPLPVRAILAVSRMQRRLAVFPGDAHERLTHFAASLRRVAGCAALSLTFTADATPAPDAIYAAQAVGTVTASQLQAWFRRRTLGGDVLAARPHSTLILTAGENDDPDLTALLDAGVDTIAVVARGTPGRGLLVCQALLASTRYRSPEQALRYLRALLPPPSALAVGPRRVELKSPERQALHLVLRGLGEKQIARELNSSPGSVHHRLKKLYRLYDVGSRAELLSLFVDRRVVRQLGTRLAARAASREPSEPIESS
jgi:DNA-binding NarL/FixJ family response regulator